MARLYGFCGHHDIIAGLLSGGSVLRSTNEYVRLQGSPAKEEK